MGTTRPTDEIPGLPPYTRVHKGTSVIRMFWPALSVAVLLTVPVYSWLEGTVLAGRFRSDGRFQRSVSAMRTDDALVLRAVIEHTIVPAVERLNSGRSRATVVLIEDRSSPLCINSPSSGAPCRIPEHWQQFLVPNPAHGWPGMIDSDQRRSELVSSLEARNALRHALPAIDHPAVVMIPVDRSEEARQRYRERAGGFSSLSLPGYAADGHALMYGSYACGSLCGYSWLFVLKKRDGKWQVQSSIVTSIS